MKRVATPKTWYLGKLKGVYATRPSAGPHKLRECIPLSVLLQLRLKYALNRKESQKICKDRQGLIKIDGKIRRDHRFPLGMMDVVSIEKTNEHFRILHDVKGRFQPHRIDAKEASFKLCKVTSKCIGTAKVPHITTHDGRTLRFPHPDIEINDCIKFNINTKEIDGVIKFVNGAYVIITGGNNIGRIGTLQSTDKHPGSYEIAKIRDSKGNLFATRLVNVMVIGDNKTSEISIPKGEGIKKTLMEEREHKIGVESDDEDAAVEDED